MSQRIPVSACSDEHGHIVLRPTLRLQFIDLVLTALVPRTPFERLTMALCSKRCNCGEDQTHHLPGCPLGIRVRNYSLIQAFRERQAFTVLEETTVTSIRIVTTRDVNEHLAQGVRIPASVFSASAVRIPLYIDMWGPDEPMHIDLAGNRWPIAAMVVSGLPVFNCEGRVR